MSELEIILILQYSNRSDCSIKVKEERNSKTFLLILYQYPKPDKRPAVRLPLAYWDACKAEDRDISNDTSRTHPCRSWVYPDSYREISRDELTLLIKSKL